MGIVAFNKEIFHLPPVNTALASLWLDDRTALCIARTHSAEALVEPCHMISSWGSEAPGCNEPGRRGEYKLPICSHAQRRPKSLRARIFSLGLQHTFAPCNNVTNYCTWISIALGCRIVFGSLFSIAVANAMIRCSSSGRPQVLSSVYLSRAAFKDSRVLDKYCFNSIRSAYARNFQMGRHRSSHILTSFSHFRMLISKES